MDLSEVIDAAERLGPIVYLATASRAGSPHVVPVHVDWHDRAAWCAVGPDDVKTRNVAANPAVCLHYPVDESTGWDHLMVWGNAEVITDVETKQRVWDLFSYDLDEFDPGGPESPATALMRIDPLRALFLKRYGFDGRAEWRA